VLIIYVDDMIITGDNSEEIKKLEERLFQDFEMKSLGRLKYFLDIEVAHFEQGIVLSQRKYILNLLAEVGLLDCKLVDTSTIHNYKIEETQDQVLTNK
jgi:Reverse transcriptase (RNA-dependent DNA polymerase)